MSLKPFSVVAAYKLCLQTAHTPHQSRTMEGINRTILGMDGSMFNPNKMSKNIRRDTADSAAYNQNRIARRLLPQRTPAHLVRLQRYLVAIIYAFSDPNVHSKYHVKRW